MSSVFMDMLQAASANVPVLPALWLNQLWQSLGWSVVLAWLGVMVVRRFSTHRGVHAGMALVMAAWTWLPGSWSPDYWLALAFQSPSVLTVLLCGLLLWPPVSGSAVMGADQYAKWTVRSSAWVWIGVALGWALLLDTFALLPVQLHAWGFSPLAAVLVMAVALLSWLFAPAGRMPDPSQWAPLAAMLLFVALHLPTGNVWDALLDPWLWLVLHGVLVRKVLWLAKS